MNFDITFGAGVSAVAQAAVNAVTAYYSSQFSDPITLNITVNFGPISGLGSSSYSLNSFTYAQIRNALIGDATTTDDTAAYGTVPITDPNPNTHTYYLHRGEQKALNLLDPNNVTSDGTVTFSNTAAFDYSRADGITAGQYDFIGVVSHEFTEIMGRQILTGANNNAQNGPANGYYPMDLFHYSSPGVRTFSGSAPGYFSIDNGNTNLGDFNTSVNGDWGDWGNVPNDSYDAFSSPGVVNDISPNDLRLMDVLGYNRVADDYGGDPNFAWHVDVGGSATGTIERSGDQDWFRIFLSGGTHYRFDETGSTSSGGTLTDTYLQLYDSSGTQLTFNDDHYNGTTYTLESQLFYTPTISGYYYISAGAYSTNSGTYTLSALLDDFAASIGTTATVAVNGTATGDHETVGDRDWFTVALTAGTSYVLTEEGSSTSAGTLSDPLMALYDSNGTLLATDDDSSGALNSRLIYTPATSGIYYIDAEAFGFNLGTYTVGAHVLNSADEFNSDSDMLFQSTDDTVTAWDTNDATIICGGSAADPGISWNAPGTGDFNADTRSDILFQNADGTVAIWDTNNVAI